MSWFSGLGTKIQKGLSKVGQKVADGGQWLGDKVGKYGDMVSKIAARAAPVAAILNPALGETIAGLGTSANIAANVGRAVSSTIRTGRNELMRN
jgi:hypothetical protein